MKAASACQIGKAPAIINAALPNNSTSMSGLNVLRIMKLGDPAAQCDIQSVDRDAKLDDVWVPTLIGDGLQQHTYWLTKESRRALQWLAIMRAKALCTDSSDR